MTGFVAQDVEQAAAETGYEFSGIHKPETADGLYSITYSEFVVPLVKAVQELSKLNDAQKMPSPTFRTPTVHWNSGFPN